MADTEVRVAELPKCQLCPNAEAEYDFLVPGTSHWGYGCRSCFIDRGGRVGVGLGQKLVLK